MPRPNTINDLATLIDLIRGCYEMRPAMAKYRIYERPFRIAYFEDIYVLDTITKAGLTPGNMFLTPIGEALDNDPFSWPRTRWGGYSRTPIEAYKRAYKWMFRDPRRIMNIAALDSKLLSQGIDFSLTGDLVGRSQTWQTCMLRTTGSLSERLLVRLLKNDQVNFGLDDKNTTKSIGHLRQLGHNILVEYHAGGEVWCEGSEREVLEPDYLSVRYCPPA